MLRLSRGVVRSAAEPQAEQQLTVELASGTHPALADVALVGACAVGDEVIVNVAARELGLASGGFDIVHVNLTRGLDAVPTAADHVLKLNYTSLQHAVHPVEVEIAAGTIPRAPVAVIGLHSQLAPLAWAFAQAAPDARLGYVQTIGGALPASRSRTVRELRTRGLLAGHVTAGPTFGAPDGEAITTLGALSYGLSCLHWDAAVAGPGPGIQGSGTPLGHGGLAALDSAHAALALGLDTIIVPRRSSSDPRSRHRGISHHTRTVLELLLAPVSVAYATGERPPAETRHTWRAAAVDLDGYARSGLPAQLMGRSLSDDPSFFTATLAGGGVLAQHLPAALRRAGV